MANLIEIQAQIESLKKQAELIRNKEFNATVAAIREQMVAFGITVKDLQSPTKKAGRKAKDANPVKAKATKGPKLASKVEPKFKGPNGEAWTGRGLTPKWLAALVAQGHSKEEFAAKPQTSV